MKKNYKDLPLRNGVGMVVLNSKNKIFVAIFGDGATGQGVYHESLNFASLHKLNVLFLCENNFR